jgi:hypothetical protein
MPLKYTEYKPGSKYRKNKGLNGRTYRSLYGRKRSEAWTMESSRLSAADIGSECLVRKCSELDCRWYSFGHQDVVFVRKWSTLEVQWVSHTD